MQWHTLYSILGRWVSRVCFLPSIIQLVIQPMEPCLQHLGGQLQGDGTHFLTNMPLL